MSYELRVRDIAKLDRFADHPSVTPIENLKWEPHEFPGYVEQNYLIDDTSYTVRSYGNHIQGIIVYGSMADLKLLATAIEYAGGRLFDGAHRVRSA